MGKNTGAFLVPGDLLNREELEEFKTLQMESDEYIQHKGIDKKKRFIKSLQNFFNKDIYNLNEQIEKWCGEGATCIIPFLY